MADGFTQRNSIVSDVIVEMLFIIGLRLRFPCLRLFSVFILLLIQKADLELWWRGFNNVPQYLVTGNTRPKPYPEIYFSKAT